MRTLCLVVLMVLMLLVVGHLCLVVRDTLIERALGDKVPAQEKIALGDELLSPRHVLLGAAVFVLVSGLLAIVVDQPSMSIAARIVLGFLVGWGSWVVARIALRRNATGSPPVPRWSVLPTAVVVGAMFAWSGIA